jgi:uncharacterized protein
MSLRVVGTAGAALGASFLGYAWCEARWFALRHAIVPVLPPGAPDLRVLHLSDLHLTPYQRRKQEWVASLRSLEPDLVVNTGDNIAHRLAIDPLMDALGPLAATPGVFVLGSNDYFSPTPRNPFRYLVPSDRRYTKSQALPWAHLVDRLGSGWTELTNRRDELTVKGVRIAFAGVDDPHLEYDELPAVQGPADADADVRIAVSHAPYLRVLDQFARDGYDLTFAGHTHGGQLCLPFKGALVTNCDLEPARAKGLHRHPAASAPGDPGSSWLHVSAGAGTSPYAVARFCCRPEATLVRLTARPDL